MKTPLTHYVIVRRDLQLGDLAAQIAHAAGESFFKLRTLVVQRSSTPVASLEGESEGAAGNAGSNPALGFNPHETIAVVLGARNERRLEKLEAWLVGNGTPHVAVRETDGRYAGELMAIGIVPTNEKIGGFLDEFHMLKECAPEPAPIKDRPTGWGQE